MNISQILSPFLVRQQITPHSVMSWMTLFITALSCQNCRMKMNLQKRMLQIHLIQSNLRFLKLLLHIYHLLNCNTIQNLIFYKTLSRLIFCYQIYRKALYLAKFNDVNFPNDNIRDYIMLYRFSKLIRENIRKILISATRTEG